jgi:hypothetical protein
LEIFLLAILIFIAVILIMIYLRKLHWDIIHNNLYDLIDQIGGKVIRHGFATRPIYYGKYKGYELTINFSTEKTKKGRKNCIDVSINKKINNSITIALVKWLNENNADILKNFLPFTHTDIDKYGISVKDKQDIIIGKLENKIKDYIKCLGDFNFIFLGVSGVLLEIACDNVAYATKHPKLKEKIDCLIQLVRVIV